MSDWLIARVSASPLTYLALFAAVGGDAVLPVIPAEPMVIAAAVLAAQGNLIIVAVVLAAVLGAFGGDHVSYFLGRRFGQRAARRISRGEKGARRLEWAERTLERRGATLLVVARFIPGGRTATTFTAGFVETFPWRRFLFFDAIAGAIWGTYTVLLGYFGGRSFHEEPWKGLLLAFGIALAVTAAIEAVRHVRARRTAHP